MRPFIELKFDKEIETDVNIAKHYVISYHIPTENELYERFKKNNVDLNGAEMESQFYIYNMFNVRLKHFSEKPLDYKLFDQLFNYYMYMYGIDKTIDIHSTIKNIYNEVNLRKLYGENRNCYEIEDDDPF